jgi:hypothetical protein
MDETTKTNTVANDTPSADRSGHGRDYGGGDGQHDGWIGVMRELLHYLSVVGADRDDAGNFLVRGSICSFLGLGGEDAEVVVGGDAEYFVGGAARNLAAGLRSTSYGLGRPASRDRRRATGARQPASGARQPALGVGRPASGVRLRARPTRRREVIASRSPASCRPISHIPALPALSHPHQCAPVP